MKKLFYVLSISLIAGFMSGCSDDDEPNTESSILSMIFDDDIVVQQPVISGNNITFYVASSSTAADLTELIPTIELSRGATVNPASGSTVDFSNGAVTFTVTAQNGVNQTTYNVSAVRSSYTESSILSMTFENSIVVQQPTIDGTNIIFYVAHEATAEDLQALVPTIELSPLATVIPESGSTVDFSNGPVDFVVMAEDGQSTTTYKVSFQRLGLYDFEEWGTEATLFGGVPVPLGGWSSSNIGAQFLMNMTSGEQPIADRLTVTQDADAYSGESAVRIETLHTTGFDLSFIKIPKVTTGTLFLGTFQTDYANTLNSTKFGIPYDKKPLTIKGYYKYTPGTDFYKATGMDDSNLAVLEPGTTDQCAITAFLYEIETDDDPYLTGLNTYESDKIVARAELADGTAKSEYTAFEIDMDYTKEYDSSKKYRFAIIFSSSAGGAKFSGAPGSVLYVDAVEVISE